MRFYEQTNFPLTLFAYGERKLLLKLAYDRQRFSDAMISRWLGQLDTVLQAMPACAQVPLADLPVLSDAERQQVLVDWNATARDYAHDRCIHELFELQAERTPDATALVYRERTLTYRELNQRANHLAQHLQALGLGLEKFAGIYVQRSLDMVIAVLGVLKAGAAYVPPDPSYPRERLAWMLEDAQATVVLTHRALLSSYRPTRPRLSVWMTHNSGISRLCLMGIFRAAWLRLISPTCCSRPAPVADRKGSWSSIGR